MRFNYKKLNVNKPYIIAEIGSNHNGDLELAKKMILVAKQNGADCVKFQSWSKDSIFSKCVYDENYFLQDDYRNRTDFTLEEKVDKYALKKNEHEALKVFCHELDIDFASTGFTNKEVDFLVDNMEVPFIKVASMDVNNLPLLKHIASKGKPVLMSTGLSKLSEIDIAIRTLEEFGCKDSVILHCVSIYPPKDNQTDLANIDTYKSIYQYPIGYSDHTIGTLAPTLAFAKGIVILEKHFTLDKTMSGWDHKVSANPQELLEIVNLSTRVREMNGSKEIRVHEDEAKIKAFRRSIVASREIKCGEKIALMDLDFKRPGIGVMPNDIDLVLGRTVNRDIHFDEVIFLKDLV